ncbi:Zinc finger and BTB domain-containing protein 24 [Triplophysa tibetana]|uniref:Zinc finger and BTB domain-containing protein 24 n=1 Tax=Triplophysa tibetana TaxID=1572043 RepID=A0A5A9NRL2_9TELE|nr:Zinc finger and BTB domain-containing protein 24 [Triplophysa tibetana]
MSVPPQPPASPFLSLHSKTHKDTILHQFDKLRRRGMLCDITLTVEDVQFKAHKALLAASSEYFSSMFTAEDQVGQTLYKLDGMSAKTFEAVLEFIYSANVSVEESSSKQLLDMARFLEIRDLVEAHEDLQEASVKRDDETSKIRSKRKRGRPKKITQAQESGHNDNKTSLPTQSNTETTSEGLLNSSSPPGELSDSDYKPREDRPRHSKRNIMQPVKLRGFRLESDLLERREPGKRGRKRKYPDTEARCEDCGKVFKSHLFLKIHRRSHTENKSFSCDKCGKRFSQKRQLKSHYRIHTGKALPECAQCHHRFLDAAQLKKHLRTHTGEKPFTCEICGKCFTAKSTLQTHIRIHRGEKPYVCNTCNKSFSDPSARRRHVATHTGHKPFMCPVCSLLFARMDNLKAHAKTHNKEPQSTDATEPAAVEATPGSQKTHSVLQLQPYQLPTHSEQEIQLVVTGEVENISLISDTSEEPGLTLLTQPPGHVQNLDLVTPGGLDAGTQIQTISVLGGQVTDGQSEQMHVITLSKEAMEHLQVHHGPQRQLQVIHQGVPQLSVPQGASVQSNSRPSQKGSIHIGNQSGQPISISQTSEQITSDQIQGQTFQIQAGTVSYLYTTSMNPHN